MRTSATLLITLALVAVQGHALAADPPDAPASSTVTTASPPVAAPRAATAEVPPAPAAAEHRTTIFGLPLNEGPIDRVARGVIAASLIGLGAYGLASKDLSTPVSGVLLGVSAIPAATAATGYCPLYQLFGVDYSF